MVFLRAIISYVIVVFFFFGCTLSHNTLQTAISNKYVEDVNLSNAITKIDDNFVINLDQQSKILKGKKLENLTLLIEGEYKGIGIMIAKDKEGIFIFDTIKNSKAENIGICKKDRLLFINKKSTKQMSTKEVSKYLKSMKNDFNLTLKNKDKEVYIVRLKNSVVNIPIVTVKELDNQILYIKITSFKNGLTKEIKEILKRYSFLKMIIIDLRDNTGGVFTQAVKLTDIFLSKGIIVTEKYKDKTKVYKASEDFTDITTPMIIIINKNTASASEIFAGSLQIHKRAKLLGEKTFGKGSVQELIKISKEKLLKLTVAYYYLFPNVRIEDIGIKPDYIITSDKISNTDFLIKKSINTLK